MSCFLDTHIAIWLFEKRLDLLSEKAKEIMEENDLFISPIVKMEIEYLLEIEKIKDDADTVIGYLSRSLDLQFEKSDFLEVIEISIHEKWTRDPFDRLIVAHAKFKDYLLISKDKKISKNYFRTIA
jgi:PIN domain nuclease of toxin-antitoxin system